MKSSIAFLFVSLFLVICINAQTNSGVKRQTDKDLRELVGSVHTVKIEGELLESSAGNESGGGWIPSLTTYNQKGDIEKFIAYDDKGNFSYQSVSEFDSSGNKVQETYSNADGAPLYSFMMNYDGEGNQIEFKNINAGGIIMTWAKFSYDKKGNIISNTSLNDEGQITFVTDLSYDENGKLHEELSRSSDGKPVNHNVYSYQKEDKSEELAVFDAQGVLECRYVTLTDEKGNQTELSYDGNGKIFSKETYEYQRDARDNWIRETESEWEGKDGVLVFKRKKLTRRTISYY